MPRRVESSRIAAFGTLALVLVAACLVSLFTGPATLSLGQLWQSAIFELRIARTIVAAIAGAGLSVAGVIFQALLRNPLAEPYVLGVSSGAAVGAAAAIVLGVAAAGVWTLPAMAFAGAAGTVFVVYCLARRPDGSVPAGTLLLSGVVVSAVLGNVLMFLVTIAPSEKLHGVVWWLLGNLQAYDGGLLRIVTAAVILALLLASLGTRDLNLLALGDEQAEHLGLDVPRTKRRLFLLASLMTGAVVAHCGLIGFVGLIVPHSVRLAFGPDHRRLMPASALAGAAFLVLADCVARTALAPREIPIGAVTTALGGPFFLVQLRRYRSGAWY